MILRKTLNVHFVKSFIFLEHIFSLKEYWTVWDGDWQERMLKGLARRDVKGTVNVISNFPLFINLKVKTHILSNNINPKAF